MFDGRKQCQEEERAEYVGGEHVTPQLNVMKGPLSTIPCLRVEQTFFLRPCGIPGPIRPELKECLHRICTFIWLV